jgi:hypothetical protein
MDSQTTPTAEELAEAVKRYSQPVQHVRLGDEK